jgi:hypothetical protein
MKVNKEISPMKDYLININNPNSYPDIIGQVDKVINKYKSQLEQLKPKKDLNELKIPQYPSSEKKNNKYSKFAEMKQIETDPYFNKVYNNIQNKNNHFKTEINNYIYEDINEEEKFNNHTNTNRIKNNNYDYNFNYKNDFTDLKLPNYNINKENIYINNNSNNNIYQNDNNNLNNDLSQEIQNDNMKLGSALTMEKSKVVQLLNLLKIKEGEINNLKQQIDNFEIKINDIENKYQNIIHSLESKQYEKLNDIYNNLSNEKNQFEIDYDNIKRNNELKFEQINDELRNYQKVMKLFFDLFNKNIDLFNKTEILPDKNIFIKESDFTEENAYLAVDVIDKLINKLVQDNKDLFNELIRLNEEMKSMNNPNDDFIQQENYSLRQLVNNLTKENNILKSNKNMNNINPIPKSNNYRISKNNQIGEREIRNSNHHHHIIHSGCRNCTPDCFRSNRSNRDLNLFDNLKLKITDLENQIKNQTCS